MITAITAGFWQVQSALQTRFRPPVRAVVDTSVLMSEHRHAVYLLARLGYFEAIWSPFIVAEFTRIRVERAIHFGVERAVYRERINRLITLLSDVFRCADARKRAHSRLLLDPDDEPVLAAALAARATYLISLNTRHFPEGDVLFGVRFITPDDFVALLSQRSAEAALPVIVETAGRQLP
jgi:predicted nucleic acid-binding protein